MEVHTIGGALVIILAVLAALLAAGYISSKGWAGSKGVL